jgi:cellulose 1,4-beta-cellobiosidase
MKFSFLASSLLVALAVGQQVGKQQTETHPKMTWKKCTGKGGTSCTTVNGEIVIDANWRWLHTSGGENCYDGNEWTGACSSATDCASNCQLGTSPCASTFVFIH